MYQCAICLEKPAYHRMVCSDCYRDYDLKSDWARALIKEEKSWRNQEARDEYYGLVVLSDYAKSGEDGEFLDGWDVLENQRVTNILSEDDWYDPVINPNPQREVFAFVGLRRLAVACGVTERELNALQVSITFEDQKGFTSETGAAVVSELEGQTVSAAAYRRRISTALEKMRVLRDPYNNRVIMARLEAVYNEWN